jgi:hypothetical protein
MPGDVIINVPDVVHETIDGETILIHLGTGAYYSLDGVGAEIWQLVVEGASCDERVARIAERYDADPALVRRTVEALVDELVGESLLTTAETELAPPDGRDGAGALDGDAQEEGGARQDGGARQEGGALEEGDAQPPATAPFAAPVLHKYTDMQEFMLVDPLHDVEADAGWPHVKAG